MSSSRPLWIFGRPEGHVEPLRVDTRLNQAARRERPRCPTRPRPFGDESRERIQHRAKLPEVVDQLAALVEALKVSSTGMPTSTPAGSQSVIWV
jgi:hypothetical protein